MGPGMLTPFADLCPDELALELGKTTQNAQHQATMRRRGVSPGDFLHEACQVRYSGQSGLIANRSRLPSLTQLGHGTTPPTADPDCRISN